MARRNRKRATIIFPWFFRMTESLHLPKDALQDLIAILWREGFKVLGPVARDGGVLFDEVRRHRRPAGRRRDEQEAGRYRLRPGATARSSAW